MIHVHSTAGHFRPGVRLQQTLSVCLHLVRVNASIHRAYWGTGNTNALRLNVYFPGLLLCLKALTRTRFDRNQASVVYNREIQTAGQATGESVWEVFVFYKKSLTKKEK